MTAQQRRVMRDIVQCRTAALGGHVDICLACGEETPSYNSCRNRHCPKCQSLAQARWIAARKNRILPVPHFHVVFTLPRALRQLAHRNRSTIFELLFHAAASTLLSFGDDRRWLGARVGITAVLHTWTRDLRFHPHLHCIVTAGGLAHGGERWVAPPRPGFLFPVRALGEVFRTRFLDGLQAAYDKGVLHFQGSCAALADPARFRKLLERSYRRRWHVYAKRPFGGAGHVMEYLGRYTHRVGISNHRLVHHDERGVRFLTRDGATTTVAPDEFIRRFLMHVLPPGFVKIRHYGLLAPGNVNTQLATAAALLHDGNPSVPPPPPASPPAVITSEALLCALTGIDLRRCPRCRSLARIRRPLQPARAPP